ncbi:GNAT family N-acetyltransferase [Celeribacter sp. PS-C1]|uniref:GNAT family N-acetyltransferase n=1 Tax=Celeribacter sp. PS-C1 TaxID=2820813 RepID=UPI001C683D8E|nr:GNAT family N-acetyltransferase [Celeribacter sp. PS-C1]MBW6417099.1 GNAT family N-acetyltransferase [Celeribacter sp. PS-C1]
MTLMTPINATQSMATQPISVRRARWGDKDALLEMIHALAHHNGDTPELDLPGLIDLMRADLPWLRLLVAERAGALIGYAGLVGGLRLQHGQKTLDLHHLFIAKEARGQGVGRALITEARATAIALGCHSLTVGTQDHNMAAQATYRACGFEPQTLTGKRFEMVLKEGEIAL